MEVLPSSLVVLLGFSRCSDHVLAHLDHFIGSKVLSCSSSLAVNTTHVLLLPIVHANMDTDPT
jgi:hypothetical protein